MATRAIPCAMRLYPFGSHVHAFTDEPFYERISMFFVFLGVFLVRMSTIQGLGVLHVWLISSIFAVFIVVLTCFCEFDKFS